MPYEHDAPPGYVPPPEPKRRMPPWWYQHTGAGFAVGMTVIAVLWVAGVRAPFRFGLAVWCLVAGELAVWVWRRRA